MFETMLITFREGLEAFLIVAITLAYLQKTGRAHLAKAVYGGIAAALLISATTSFHIQELAEDPVMEGTLAMIAGVLVASMTFYVIKNARNIKTNITDKIEHSAAKTGNAAYIGVFLFITLMIAREGMETALMLGGISTYAHATAIFGGAVGGLLIAALFGALWVKQSSKINLRLFMQVTGIFLFLFSIQLFLYGIHELSEMNALLPVEEWNYPIHMATEMFAHGHWVAQTITYSLLAVPCAWLAFSFISEKCGTNKQFSAAE